MQDSKEAGAPAPFDFTAIMVLQRWAHHVQQRAREAWRLQLQQAKKKSALPASLQATPQTVERSARLLRKDLESLLPSAGGIKGGLEAIGRAWGLQAWANFTKAEGSPVSSHAVPDAVRKRLLAGVDEISRVWGQPNQWIIPESRDADVDQTRYDREVGAHSFAGGMLSWNEAENSVTSMAEALLVHETGLDASALAAFDWKSASRATLQIDRACRAIQQLWPSIRQAVLPDGCKIRYRVVSWSPILQMSVVDSEGKRLGPDAETMESAVASARLQALAERPFHEVTAEQFVSLTTVIRVADDKSKGKRRVICEDLDELSRLQYFLARMGEHRFGEKWGAMGAEARHAFVSEQMVGIVNSQPFNEPCKSIRIAGVGHLLLFRAGPVPTNRQIRNLHSSYVSAHYRQEDVDPPDELGGRCLARVERPGA